MATVEIRNIEKSFGEKTRVLEGIGFKVEDGEFVSLLGPSGCGKTTLVRIIAGLEFADAGEIFIDGSEISRVSPKQRDIAMVFQNYALYPHLLVEENIAMGLKLRKFPPGVIQERVAEAARMLGLEALLKRKPSALSGGQRQRVALARALVRRPKVYLLDEPLSNLDAVLRDRTRGELKLLFKRVRGTTIYVTHDQVEAMTLSDRIVVLNRGVIQQIGTPQEIYNHPANTFVASFLGAPPMNIFSLEAAVKEKLVNSRAGATTRLCGIRPENIVFAQSAASGFVRVNVKLTEPTGAQVVLTLEAGPLTLRAVRPVGPDRSRVPQVWIKLPAEQLHFFDA